MPILFCTDIRECAAWIAAHPSSGHCVLATAGVTEHEEALRTAAPELIVAEVGSQRFARLNFDQVGVLVLDLDEERLLTSPGRRLVETLARLAEETLCLVFAGPVVGACGGRLADGVHAGLSLVPATAILPDIRAIGDLRSLLATLSESGTRLLALDAPVRALYDRGADTLAVTGDGSALLVSFVSAGGALPTARLHLLSDGMSAAWPE